MAEKKKTEAAEGAAKPKNKLPLFAIIGVVMVAALVITFVIGRQVAARSKPGAPKKVEHGPVMPLEDFLVNLADPGGDHFLKVTVNLELNKEKGKTPEAMKEQVSLVRDAVLMALSSKTRDELAPPAGREKLKAEIKKKVNEALDEEDVQGVYFSNFVTQ